MGVPMHTIYGKFNATTWKTFASFFKQMRCECDNMYIGEHYTSSSKHQRKLVVRPCKQKVYSKCTVSYLQPTRPHNVTFQSWRCFITATEGLSPTTTLSQIHLPGHSPYPEQLKITGNSIFKISRILQHGDSQWNCFWNMIFQIYGTKQT